MKIKRILFVLSILLFTQQLQAQDVTVTGQVTSAGSGEPLVGVSVLVEGTSRGVVTNLDGIYEVTVRSGENGLILSYIGFRTTRVTIDGRTRVDVAMAPEVTQFDDVVVTAFGIERERRSLGYAVQDVSGDALTSSGSNNLLNALQGQVAGVQINRGGGGAGQGSQIFIRGFTSLNPSADNQPLFVVDGVPIDNSTTESSGRPRGMSNRAIDIDPTDIASVTVLRSAPATALYGVRAANGAIIITTKKGQPGDVRVNFSHTVTFDDVINRPEYQDVYGPGFGFAYDPNGFWPSWGMKWSEVAAVDPERQYFNNWENSMQTGVGINNAVTVSGGSQFSTFYTSISDSRNEGIIPNNDWNRTSVRVSGQSTLGALNVGASANYINSGGSRVPFVSFMERLSYWNTSADVRDYRFDDGRHKGDNIAGTGSGRNPVYDANTNTYVDNVNRLIGNINASLNLTNWLAVEYRIGLDTYNDQRTEIEPGRLGIPGEFVWTGATNGFREETRINSRDFTSNLSLRFQHNINEDFTIDGRIGNDVFERSSNVVSARGTTFDLPRFEHFSNATNVSIAQSSSMRRLIGFYGDINVDYRNIVYLNVTGRNDMSSTLPEENRSFFYPSVSLGLVFSDLIDLPDFVTYGKLRASYAEIGKDASPYLLSSVYVIPGEYPINNLNGFTRGSRIGSPDLKPERTTSNEFGLDLRFLENRLGLDFTYYKSNSKDMIINVPVSNATGFGSVTSNAGEIENKGIELTFRATAFESRDLRWNITSNFTRNRNEVVGITDVVDAVFLGNIAAYINRPFMQLVPGQSYGAIWGTSYKRYYANGEPDDLVKVDKSRPVVIESNPASPNYGFPVIDTNAKIVGDALPDWTLNIGNTVNFRNWDFTANIDIVMGVDKYNKLDQWDASFGHTTNTLNREDYKVIDGVFADGTPNNVEVWLGQGVDPVNGRNYGAGYHRNYYRVAVEKSVEDASYVKLRTLAVGYTLPQSLVQRLPLRSLRAGVAANNLLLWTPWSQYDPEAFVSSGSNLVGLVDLAYPGTRSVVFSLNFSF